MVLFCPRRATHKIALCHDSGFLEACFLRVGAQRQHLRRNGYTYITMDESQSSLSPNETMDGTVGRLFPVHQTTPAGLRGNCCGRPGVVKPLSSTRLSWLFGSAEEEEESTFKLPAADRRGGSSRRGEIQQQWQTRRSHRSWHLCAGMVHGGSTARCGCRPRCSRLPPPGEHGSDEIPGHRLGGAGISRAHTRAQFGPRPVS